MQLQVKKETLLDPGDLQQFQNHSSQMAALDFVVSVASNVFIPTYDGNMAKVVEGHRRYNDKFLDIHSILILLTENILEGIPD